MASTGSPLPGDQGFRVLQLGAGTPGRVLNQEAVSRLGLAYDAGWSYDDLADLYEELKAQIESSVPGWRADRVICSDGSHAFIGSLGPVLVIMPDRSIYRGVLGATAADGLLCYTGFSQLPSGAYAFPPPSPSAPGTRRVR